ncbi:hypothetical protein EVAR_40077_1 [Eumeta japonica]|uniref:Uncharacterized protein n=1 Tax=Eumeta variegata TaxID=151549 RepID=A0A4C1X5D3_EUMVA|nr:hypothetical protein EVAR_40077_1 [Eumeta japonica]
MQLCVAARPRIGAGARQHAVALSAHVDEPTVKDVCRDERWCRHSSALKLTALINVALPVPPRAPPAPRAPRRRRT